MNIQVNRISHPVTSLGPGRRIVVWLQGCSRHCPGCDSIDTWDCNAGKTLNVEYLAARIARIVKTEHLDGISITGGEPFEQADALICLLEILKNNLCDKSDDAKSQSNFSILVFTGFSQGYIRNKFPLLDSIVDVLVCGSYMKDRPKVNCLIASSNQKLVYLNELVKADFQTYLNKSEQPIQFDIKGSDVYIVGIPNNGDLSMIQQQLKERGIVFKETSWQN